MTVVATYVQEEEEEGGAPAAGFAALMGDEDEQEEEEEEGEEKPAGGVVGLALGSCWVVQLVLMPSAKFELAYASAGGLCGIGRGRGKLGAGL